MRIRAPIVPLTRRNVLAAGGISALWLAGACGTTQRPPLQEITFTLLAGIGLDVARLETAVAFESPLKEPNVEHLFAFRPAQVAVRWATNRLRPANQAAPVLARFIVLDGACTHTALPPASGALLAREQAWRYDLAVEARLEIRPTREGPPLAVATARATRLQSTTGDLSIADREEVWHGMTQGLMADFNREMEAQTRAHLARWVR